MRKVDGRDICSLLVFVAAPHPRTTAVMTSYGGARAGAVSCRRSLVTRHSACTISCSCSAHVVSARRGVRPHVSIPVVPYETARMIHTTTRRTCKESFAVENKAAVDGSALWSRSTDSLSITFTGAVWQRSREADVVEEVLHTHTASRDCCISAIVGPDDERVFGCR